MLSDRIMLQRILSNLMDNAFKAANRVIKVTIDKSDTHWQVVVNDDGVGIAREDIERIFDSYVSSQEHAGGQAGGYGLGLYIVKEFSQALGGEIAVDSQLGQGATFTLSLPIEQPLLQSNEMQAGRLPAIERLSGLKVLVVDDETIVLDAMLAILNGWGCDVALAKNAETALSKFDTFKPDIMLLDYHLQGTTGPELWSELEAKHGQELAAIIITGATESAILTALRKRGLTVLSKPVEPNALANALINEVALD